MTILDWTAIACGLFSGILKGWQDKIMAHGDMDADSERKYKQPKEMVMFSEMSGIARWYYTTYKLKYLERFPLSATLLVSLTSWWHFAGMLRVGIVYLMIFLLTGSWWVLFIAVLLRLHGFHLVYSR